MTTAPFLRACRREQLEHPPVWFMRQAGRYMSEYRAIRKEHTLIELCQTPELAAEVTMQPMRALDVDAAILFSDILLPFLPMGLELDYVKGEGPVIGNPIRTPDDVDRLQPVDVKSGLGYVHEAVRLINDRLDDDKPLIGFAGAPFTLASYAIEGGASRHFLHTKRFMHEHEDAWHRLLGIFADVVADHLVAQVEAGAGAVQLFDSWVGQLGPDEYREFVLPHSRAVLQRLAPSGVPRIHFGVGAGSLLEMMRDAGADVVGVDWRMRLDDAWDRLGPDTALQGNLDPAALFAPRDVLRRRVEDVLAAADGRPGHIFNLGHGILPETPVENVRFVVDLIKGRA